MLEVVRRLVSGVQPQPQQSPPQQQQPGVAAGGGGNRALAAALKEVQRADEELKTASDELLQVIYSPFPSFVIEYGL